MAFGTDKTTNTSLIIETGKAEGFSALPSFNEALAALPRIFYQDKLVYMSQSGLKSWEKRTGCNKRDFQEGILGKFRHLQKSSIAQQKGLRFEYLMGIENSKGAAGAEAILTDTTKKVSSHERCCEKSAKIAVEVLKTKLNINLETAKKQRKVRLDEYGMGGDYDVQQDCVIVDVKYSGVIVEESSDSKKRSEFAWYDADDDSGHQNHISRNKGHWTQATHYTLLSKLEGCETTEFYFAVFYAAAWKNQSDFDRFKIFKMNVTEIDLIKHLQRLTAMAVEINELIDTGFIEEETPGYRNCKSCPMADTCESAVKAEGIIEVFRAWD